MKILNIIILIVTCCVGINANAQNSATPQKRTNYIQQHVSGITSDQVSKVLLIEQNCSSAMQNPSIANNRSSRDSLRRDVDSKIKEVLTPDQYSQYIKIKKNLPKESTNMD